MPCLLSVRAVVLAYHAAGIAQKYRKSRMPQQEYISNQPIVIDNGTGLMKAGLAGVERPNCEFRSYVGFQKYDRVVINGYAPADNL